MKVCGVDGCHKQAIIKLNYLQVCIACLKKINDPMDQRCTRCHLQLKMCSCQYEQTPAPWTTS